MSIDKKVNYEIQGGARNYLGKQREVKAPLKWKSSPDSPETELAYITKAEKDLLVKKDIHGSLNGDVNRGPSGIMSLDGFGSFDSDDPSKDTGMSGTATSAAETGSRNARDIRDVQAQMNTGNLGPGTMPEQAKDYRNAFIAAGGGQRVNPGFFDSRDTVSPAELAAAKAYNPTAFRKTRGGGLGSFISGGGLLGNIVRGIGQKFGLGKRYNEPTYDMSQYSAYGLGGSQTPAYYNDLGNELMLSTKETPQENEFNYMYDINDLASLIEASKVPQSDFEYLGPNFNEGLLMDYQDIGATGNNLGRSQLVNSGTITPLEDDFTGQSEEGIMGIDVGQDDVAFENDLMAELATNSPALAQKRSLQKKQRLSELGGPEFTNEDQRKLDLLNQMEADPNKIYSQTV